MKILIVQNALTHYFNLITSKINDQPDVEIIYVHPKNKSTTMGEGVFETREGVNFKLIPLEEGYDQAIETLYFIGLAEVVKTVAPDIILVGEPHVKSLLFDKKLHSLIQNQRIKIVLKSIPFRLKKFEDDISDAIAEIKKSARPPFSSVPGPARKLLKVLQVDVLYNKLVLQKKGIRLHIARVNERKRIYNAVDAHVNYIEAAYEIFASYGVPAHKIFITYNSPDTDHYFSIKEKISGEDLPLPYNSYRIVHLSRLVEWKRVDMLVNAVANMKTTFPQMELIVIGNGPEKENLINLAGKLGVEDSVKFLGGLYDIGLLGKYLMSSGIYVLAGMGGLSINDAMIFGLPVICSVCDGTEKFLVKEGYNGLYFKEGVQSSLEEKISFLFQQPELCKTMGNNSVELIRNEINIHTVVGGYMKAFHYVLSN